jgi:signal transduction histidine kinase
MKLTKLITLLLIFLSFTALSFTNSEKTPAEKLLIIESLVGAQPAQALTSIAELNKIKEQLTPAEVVKLIRHEVIANIYLNRHNFALETIQKIKIIADNENSKIFWWQYYNLTAIVYWHMDNIEDSLKFHLKAYDVVKSINEHRDSQGLSEGNIGYSLVKLGFYKKSIPYFESALALAIEDENNTALATGYNNLGEAYLGLHNYQKSFELLEKALAIRTKHKLTFHSSYSYQNLGKLYFAQKKYLQSEVAFKKAIKIREEAGFVKGVMVSRLSLAEVYLDNNKHQLAEQEVETVISIAKEQDNDTNLSQAYNLQRRIHAINQDYLRAYQTSLNYEQTLEKVVSRKTSTKLASFLSTSEVISKDLNILELENKAKIKELQVANERENANLMLTSGLFIVAILVVFLWYLQKSKKIIAKSNDELSLTLTELKQTQEKLVKSGKMSALTTLVSRMAHQVNTPLGIAVTGVSHIHEKVERFSLLIDGGKVKKTEIDAFISDLHKGCDLSSNSMSKVADLISQFKMIAANLEAETLKEFEILALINKQVELALIPFDKNKPIINVSGDPVTTLGYPEALNKVLSQLITNSIDHAFEETLLPQIDIEVSTLADHIEIQYQDNGKGIDSAIVNDVFEPFYTTTMGNKNLGIGLSIVYNLVVQLMQGNIQCLPKQDKGIMFVINLPKTMTTV